MTMNNIRRLAFIGGGNMAAALIGGLTKRGLPSERLVVADPSAGSARTTGPGLRRSSGGGQRRRGQGRRSGDTCGQTAANARRGAGAGPHLAASTPLVISVAAGIPHAALARWFGPQIPVIRTMPNRPALNGFGATGLYAPAERGRSATARWRKKSWPRSAPRCGSNTNRRWTPSPPCPAAARPIFSCSWRRSRQPRMSAGCPPRSPIS